jgi:tRNA uridine 5-carboxymethylaminomethyl modification enzyme
VKLPGGSVVPATKALRQPEVSLQAMLDHGEVQLHLDDRDRELDVVSVETAAKYDGYLQRQTQAVERSRKQEGVRIPTDFPFDKVQGLSNELVQRFTQRRPETLGQALRIPGATPAAVAVISAFLRHWSPERADVHDQP